MAKRHDDALFIQEGACNPSGIAHSIINAQREILSEPESGTRKVTGDPAVQLMVHQLAYICGLSQDDTGQFNWRKAYDECLESCAESTLETIGKKRPVEDAADVATAKRRLAEIEAQPDSLVSGEALQARLDGM